MAVAIAECTSVSMENRVFVSNRDTFLEFNVSKSQMYIAYYVYLIFNGDLALSNQLYLNYRTTVVDVHGMMTGTHVDFKRAFVRLVFRVVQSLDVMKTSLQAVIFGDLKDAFLGKFGVQSVKEPADRTRCPQHVGSHQRNQDFKPYHCWNGHHKLVWRKDNVILGNRRHDVRMRIRLAIMVLSKRVVHPYELNFIVYYRHRFGQRLVLHDVI